MRKNKKIKELISKTYNIGHKTMYFCNKFDKIKL